ncbi:hypothetical protein [Maritimibacter sp. DP1N21-5]|uniref:hypothetical protein n=1 Tax=Maritimibacter sp. DP1N21-5 TaxID=2836867 RepID=UPI001C467348|nr:hypothetical protein [Maritimibacter sp. DP1N21-5]MBV7409136.1 hypothetical protein [Maritimibacter sp. DP1N21-5]
MDRVRNQSLDREGAAAFDRLRLFLGGLGIFLPLVLALAGRIADGHLQPTISDYFHTTQRDLLVGGLCAMGVFLAVHKRWEPPRGRLLPPDRIARLAGLAAIGVAFFPNESQQVDTLSQKMLGLTLAPVFHYGAALMLYLMMSMSCFLVFAPQSRREADRRFHLWMGRIIFAAGCMVMVLSGIKNNAPAPFGPFVAENNLIFWDESVGVWAFCASWILSTLRERWRLGLTLSPRSGLPSRHLWDQGPQGATDPAASIEAMRRERLARLLRQRRSMPHFAALPQPSARGRLAMGLRRSRPRRTSPARTSGTAG